jgi:hypothetical protein
MPTLTTSVTRLRRDLQKKLERGTLSQRDMGEIWDRVADLLLRALSDAQHPLSEELAKLQERVQLERDGSVYKSLPEPPAHDEGRSLPPPSTDPYRHLFMPHPGIGDPEKRRYWRLQLLLQAAAWSPSHATRLAARLSLSPDSMRRAAEAAAASSVRFWSRDEFARRLHEALADLDYPEPPLPFRLEGRLAHLRDESTVRLSPQQARFLQMLVDRVDLPVEQDEFKKAGIKYPVKLKGELVKKFREAGIELSIIGSPGHYRLLAP